MAGRKKKGAPRKRGPPLRVPSNIAAKVDSALKRVREAKAMIRAGYLQGCFALLHRVESNLTRVGILRKGGRKKR